MPNTDASDQLIQRALAAANQNDFSHALTILYEAEEQSLLDEERRRIRDKRKEIHHLQTASAQGIITQLQALQRSDVTDVDKATQLVDQLDEVLGPQDQWLRDWQEWKQWGTWAKQQLQEREAEREIAELRKQIHDKWATELLVDATEALRIIEPKAAEHKGSHAWELLLEEAKSQRQKAAAKESVWLTCALSMRYREIINDFHVARERGFPRLPLYAYASGALVQVGYAPSIEAIDRLVQLAGDYENKKANERLEQAQKAMPASPHGAKQYLDEALAFEFISDYWKATLTKYLKETVEPAIQKREATEKNIQDILDHVTDAWDAWKRINQLAEDDPYSPKLEHARNTLRKRVRRHLERELENADTMRRAGNLAEARRTMQTIRDLIAGDDKLKDLDAQASTLLGKINEDEVFRPQIATEVARINEALKTDPSQASQDLQLLEEDLKGRRCLMDFPEVGNLRRRIDLRVNRQAFVRELDERLRTTHDSDELKELEAECQDAIDRYGKLSELLDLKNRIAARIAFLNAEVAYQQEEIQQAKEQYNRVIALNGDDTSIAKERVHALWVIERNDTLALLAKNDVIVFYKTGHLYEALQRLRNSQEDWTRTQTPRRMEITKLYSKWLDEWKKQIVAELKLVEKKSPLPYQAIERLLTHLREDTYDPVLSAHWDARLSQRCAKAREQEAQGIPKRRKK